MNSGGTTVMLIIKSTEELKYGLHVQYTLIRNLTTKIQTVEKNIRIHRKKYN